MIVWNNFYYDTAKQYTKVLFICDSCKKEQFIRKQSAKRKKYTYCHDCYQKSPERKITAKKVVKNRRSFNGEENPNYKGRLTLQCVCKNIFTISQYRKDTAKFCSYKCAASHRPHAIKRYKYGNIFFRSSWEAKFAQHLDSINIKWKYEPEAFETSFGNYTPDFWIPSWDSFVEVKGWFRKDAQGKFDEFSKNHKIILADKTYLKILGII